MASIKVKFRPSVAGGEEGVLCYQVSHKRSVRQINTGYIISRQEWNADTDNVSDTTDTVARRQFLQELKEKVLLDRKLLTKVITSFYNTGIDYTADDVVRTYLEKKSEQSFYGFMQAIITQLQQLNKVRTSETYISAFNSFRHFRQGEDILLDSFNSNLMLTYEAWLRQRGVSMNTVSFYMRILRAVYNRAVERELTEQRRPFRHVYTGIEKTAKRAIDMKAVKKLKDLDLHDDQRLDFARDMFMFSFYTRGMSFIDMCFLQKANLRDGILTYRRRKTGQQLQVRWERCMQEIVDKYKAQTPRDSPYMLPVITKRGFAARRQYICNLHILNGRLKELAKLCRLRVNLTMYVARHSWASIARHKNVPISVISEGMGHDSEATTMIYLDSIETSAVDKANRMILSEL